MTETVETAKPRRTNPAKAKASAGKSARPVAQQRTYSEARLDEIARYTRGIYNWVSLFGVLTLLGLFLWVVFFFAAMERGF